MYKKIQNNIMISFILKIVFALVKLIGGAIINSISIMADSIHDFGNAFAIFISFLCEKKAHHHPDNEYTFGYLRFSLIGALVSSVFLAVGSCVVFINAIPRLINPVAVDYNSMIILSIFGLAINGIAFYRTSKCNNINEKAINLHFLEDVFVWISIIIGSLLIRLTGFYAIDPILSIMIAIFIVVNVFKHLKEIIEIFLEKIPDDIDIKELKHQIKEKYKDIIELKQVRILSIDGNNNYVSMIMVVNNKMTKNEIIELKNSVKDDLEKSDISHTIIEIEFDDEKKE